MGVQTGEPGARGAEGPDPEGALRAEAAAVLSVESRKHSERRWRGLELSEGVRSAEAQPGAK